MALFDTIIRITCVRNSIYARARCLKRGTSPMRSIRPAHASEGHEDDDLFKEAMRGVEPLRVGHSRTVDMPPEPKRSGRALVYGSKEAGPSAEPSDQPIQWLAHDASSKRIQELRSGRLVPQGKLDLHRRTVDEVESLVPAFLRTSQVQGRGCVLIIHGRGIHSGPGGPRIRGAVVRLLSKSEAVLAFVDAPRQFGGTGAILGLLRNARPGQRRKRA